MSWPNAFTTVGLLIVSILIGAMVIPLLTNWYRLIIVQSGSMEPDIPVGSLVVSRPSDEYVVGEVVVFSHQLGENQRLVIHRLTELVNDDKYLAKGNGFNNAMQLVDRSQIEGSVWLVVPWIGYLLNWLQSPIGVLSVLLMIVVLGAATELGR